MKTTRYYVHRTHGEIGEVTLVAPDGKWALDGKELPASSIEHLLNFALQTLQDAYAGAKNEAEAVGAFESKRDRLLDGSIGVRGTGEGVSEETAVARSIMRGLIKDKLGAKSPEWTAFTALDPKEQNAKLDANIEANSDALAPVIAAKLAERKAERDRKAKAKGAVEISI